MTELTDVEGAFAYGESLLVGKRVRLRAVCDADLADLARWEMDPARMTTSSNWVIPPSESAARERIAKWCANDKDDVGFSVETLDRSPILVGFVGLFGARPKDRCASIAIGFGRNYVGRGYGSDAMRVIASYAFSRNGFAPHPAHRRAVQRSWHPRLRERRVR